MHHEVRRGAREYRQSRRPAGLPLCGNSLGRLHSGCETGADAAADAAGEGVDDDGVGVDVAGSDELADGEVVASVLAPGAISVAKERLAVSTPALAPAAPTRPLIQTSPTVTPSPAPCAPAPTGSTSSPPPPAADHHPTKYDGCRRYGTTHLDEGELRAARVTRTLEGRAAPVR